MRSNCLLRINREGKFSISPDQAHYAQCGSVGVRVYEYFVTIEMTNRCLTPEGYVIENGLVDKYFQETYTKNKKECQSCEVMAQCAIDDLRKLISAQNKCGDLRRILVRIHGSPYSYIEAEWKAASSSL